MTPSHLVIVMGLAGAGKTVALNALEDLGYHTTDNLPLSLLFNVIQGPAEHPVFAHWAVSLTAYDHDFQKEFELLLPKIQQRFQTEILFLTAASQALVNRFRETRRLHPLSKTLKVSLPEAFVQDRFILRPLQPLATHVFDTTHTTPLALKRHVTTFFAVQGKLPPLQIKFMSFGFKHGLPNDVDVVHDVRCFSNPYYDDTLRVLTGLDDRVKDFVLSDTNVQTFVQKITDLFGFLFPLYFLEGKRYLTWAIGCTGGQHRSVVIVEEISRQLNRPEVVVEHRHLFYKKP